MSHEITIDAYSVFIDAGPDQTICSGNLAVLSAQNPTGVPINWNNGIIDGVPFLTLSDTQYIVQADNNGCISFDTLNIFIEELPTANFSPVNTEGCEPLEVSFVNLSLAESSLIECNWGFELDSMQDCADTVSFVYTEAVEYDVSLAVSSLNGCKDTITFFDLIFVEQTPIADFTVTPELLNSVFPEATFTNESINATEYNWSFGDGITSNETNPVHLFSEFIGESNVVLVAFSPLGCADTASLILSVKEELIYYVPNTFTPDGDQFNDIFTPVFYSGFSPENYRLAIYNRWGDIVFESLDLKVGWDGTYSIDGRRAQDGVYTWVIQFQLNENREMRVTKGHVSVIQ